MNLRKHCFVLGCIIFSYTKLMCQDTIVAIAPTKMNVAYLGVDNPLTVVSTIPYDSITTNNGNIQRDSLLVGNYIYSPATTGAAQISLWRNGTKFETQTFRIKRIPLPSCSISGYSENNGTIILPKAQLVLSSGIVASPQGFDFDARWVVLGFSIAIMQDGLMHEYNASGSSFSEAMKSVMQKMNPEESLLIEQIKVRGPDGRIVAIPSVKVIVK